MNASANPLIPLRRMLARVLPGKAERRSSHTLILGIGNPLRGDDGLGRVVAEQLAQSHDLDCEIQVVHQLTPELAQYMAVADLVVMIDASREGEPGEVRVHLLLSSPQSPGRIGTHHVAPEELAMLTTTLYGCCPPVVVITMTGADFSMGERLSPVVAQQISFMEKAVYRFCTEKSFYQRCSF